MRRIIVRDRERIIEISTMDFLKALEAEQRIQSADAVLDRALETGRRIARTSKVGSDEQSLRKALGDAPRQAENMAGAAQEPSSSPPDWFTGLHQGDRTGIEPAPKPPRNKPPR